MEKWVTKVEKGEIHAIALKMRPLPCCLIHAEPVQDQKKKKREKGREEEEGREEKRKVKKEEDPTKEGKLTFSNLNKCMSFPKDCGECSGDEVAQMGNENVGTQMERVV